MSVKPRITLGMATYDDNAGLEMTVQSAAMHNTWQKVTDLEIVVIDNSPIGSPHRDLNRSFVNFSRGVPVDAPTFARTPLCKYVEMPHIIGTTAPRDAVFQHATADIVVVVDCHVMGYHNWLTRLLNWFDRNPNFMGLVHGPIMYNDLLTHQTHLNDRFRAGMRGTWSSMWRSPSGDYFSTEGVVVTDAHSAAETQEPMVRYYRPLPFEKYPTDANGNATLPSGFTLPGGVAWPGHDRVLKQLGCVEVGLTDSDEAFEIPGCGMGMFACRKAAWPGFAKNCSGFGGEEMNIHDRFRKMGQKVVCLPFLKWWHRFERVGNHPYPNPTAAHVRNHLLWLAENGGTPERVHKHYVESGLLAGQQSEAVWQKMLADPVNYHIELKPRDVATSGEGNQMDVLYAKVLTTPRDLDKLAEIIKRVSERVASVVGFVKRAEWEPAVASGYPGHVHFYQEEPTMSRLVHKAVEEASAKRDRQIVQYSTTVKPDDIDPLTVAPKDCELLIIDKENSAPYLSGVLERHAPSCSKYILIRGAQNFGEKSECGTKPGMWEAVKDWVANNPEWFIAFHNPQQFGLTMLARDPEPRPEVGVYPWPGPGYGPGTELHTMLASVGINPSAGCGCHARMRQMDEWGISGCLVNRDLIVGWLEQNAERWGWTKAAEQTIQERKLVDQFGQDKPEETIAKLSTVQKLGIAWRSFTTGLAFKVDWTNPYPGLVDESIRRAAIAESQRAKK
jgi:hypothetical protein